MARQGENTRERILDAAHGLTLERGFAASSIDMVLERAGITKGAFFYHFKSKADLARALVERYAAAEDRMLQEALERAEKLSRDPLQQMLIVVGLAIEMFEALDEPHPGCLFASFCYQNELVSDEVRGLIRDGMLAWRRVFADKLHAAAAHTPPRMDVDLERVADMFLTVFEGAFVMARSLDDAKQIADQLRNYRNYLELLFTSAA